MPHSWRYFRPALLLAILLTLAFPLAAGPAAAQDDESQPVVIDGSLQLEPLLIAIRDAYAENAPDADIQITPQGPKLGFEAMCSGEADMVMSTEPITDQQIARCSDGGVDFIETVIAYEAVVLIASPAGGIDCLSRDQIDTNWSLGAPESVTWTDLGALEATDAVTFVGPQDFSPAAVLLADMLPAGDLREDIVTHEDVAAVLDDVQTDDANAVGFLSLADLQALDPDGEMMPLDVQDENGVCIAPTLDALADGSYPLSRAAYLYVSADSAQRDEVQAFLTFALTDESGARANAADLGFTVPDENTFEAGLANVQNGNIGRTFSRATTPVLISTSQPGAVVIGGSSMLYNLTKDITRTFESSFVNAQVVFDTLGNTAGWAAFCAGEVDVLQTTREPSEDELAACADAGIEPYTVDMGYEALVLAVPESNDWAECVDTETVTALFGMGEEAPLSAQWSDVNADWPDEDLLLVVPPVNTGDMDYLIGTLLGDLSFVVRSDMLEDDDPLYRAQGVANTTNGLAVLLWSQYQRSDAALTLLAVDAGDGCVAPDPETFADGTYSLSYPVRYYFSDQALFSNGLARALLWHFYSDDSLDVLADYPFSGLDLDAMGGAQRTAVFDMLAALEDEIAAEAEAAEEAEEAAGPEAEATEEAEVEPTAEATEEAEVEPTAEATEEAEPEAAVTEETEVELTAEATEEAEVEPTAEATEEAAE